MKINELKDELWRIRNEPAVNASPYVQPETFERLCDLLERIIDELPVEEEEEK